MATERARFTETLEEFLQDHESSQDWQVIKNKMDSVPHFTIDELDYDLYSMFKERYYTREIGAEDEGIFYHNCNVITDRVIMEYVPKINLYVDKYNSVADRLVTINEDGENNVYLQPINTTNRKLATSTAYINNRKDVINKNKDNAELLDSAMNIKNIYLECIDSFDILFMGIY